MYCDEFGNMWASYEDYQTYLRETSVVDKTKGIVNSIFKDLLGNVYIDDKGQMWESEQKYIDNDNNLK